MRSNKQVDNISPFSFSLVRWLLSAGAIAILVGQTADAALFQHFDASVADSFDEFDGTLTWIDLSGNGRHATDDALGGTVSLSNDTSVFPTELNSIDFDTVDGRARMQLLDANDAATLFDQSQVGAQGFSVFVAVRGEGGGTTWNDLIGSSSIVNDGFLMRWHVGNGRFQTSVDAPDFGNGTAQNGTADHNNYNSGDAMVLAMNYQPESSEIILASTHNSYSQTFSGQEPEDFSGGNPLWLGNTTNGGRFFDGQIGEVMIYDVAFAAEEFAGVLDFLAQKWLGDPVGGVPGDFNEDGVWDTADIDLLGKEIIAGTNNPDFDITGDATVSQDDLNQWLSVAATENGFGAPYLGGDANLDGTVNAQDLNSLALNWQENVDPWSQGDFNTDGFVDASDLNALALNWQESIPTAVAGAAVPEPNSLTILCLGVITLVFGRRIGVR